jgi:hypothetical protein
MLSKSWQVVEGVGAGMMVCDDEGARALGVCDDGARWKAPSMLLKLWRVVEQVGGGMTKARDDEGARALGVCDDGARWYQTMHDAPSQPNTVRPSERMGLRKAHSLGHVATD